VGMGRAIGWILVAACACACACARTYSYSVSPYRKVPQARSVLVQRAALAAEATSAAITSPLESAPAVRHRRMWSDIVVAVGPSQPPPAQVLEAATDAAPEKEVIEAWIGLQTDDVVAAVDAVRAQVEADGGRVVSENIEGQGESSTSAAIELRVPPAKARPLVAWFGKHWRMTSRRILATDVSKALFDQELALANLRLTMGRLQELAKTASATKDLIELEAEMTRVRGEIEKVEGDQRFLLDRVAYATVTLEITRDGPPVEFAPGARLHPGLHVSTFVLFDPQGRARTRAGGGLAVHVSRWLTFELDGFPERGDDSRIVIATVGSALYSGRLGYGRRRFLNPYLGVRAGYAYVDGEGATAVAGELGLELFRSKSLLVDLSTRLTGLFHSSRNDIALHTTLGFAVPF
jgi:hypothetical protein